MKTYFIEGFAFDGEASFPICQTDDEKMAILIAQNLDRYGKFKGQEFLTGIDTNWQLRIIEDDNNGAVDVIWEGQPSDDYDPTPCCYQHSVGAISTDEPCPKIADND